LLIIEEGKEYVFIDGSRCLIEEIKNNPDNEKISKILVRFRGKKAGEEIRSQYYKVADLKLFSKSFRKLR